MNRTSIILILALLTTLTSHGQDSQDLNKYTWGFGGYFMPSLIANPETSGEIGFAPVTGLRIEKQLTNRLTLGSGMTYYTTDMFNGSWWGASCATPNSTCHWYSKRTYLEVPINLRFIIQKKGAPSIPM